VAVLDRIGCTRKERVFAKRKMEGRAVLDTVPSGTLRDVPGGAVVVFHCGCVLLLETPSFNFSERHAEAAGGKATDVTEDEGRIGRFDSSFIAVYATQTFERDRHHRSRHLTLWGYFRV
jgi:hypothetical protein